MNSNSLVPAFAGDIFTELERVFGTPTYFTRDVATSAKRFPLDVIEGKDRYTIRASLPGVSRESIEVESEGGYLTIGVKEKSSCTTEGDPESRYIRKECYCGSQSRTLALPEGADAEDIKASLKDGILEVVLKKKEEQLSRKIVVE